ncbi:DUF3099 domain-containing protein [Microbacterium sp. P06]|uniref:DUF3099 domain-containing protein n=1 Tax=unclassified Microbacterium TaxID=2609290 RepID=UPI003745D84C
MKTTTPSATSLPIAPKDDAGSRLTKYMVMMGIRIVCIVAMVLIQPFGWYTFVFAAGAVVLPYIAVVIANVGSDVYRTTVVSPERMLEAPAPAAAAPQAAPAPTVIRITETPRLAPGSEPRP